MQAPLTPPTRFLVQHKKIVDYLLNLGHPDGGAKAAYFIGRGFSLNDIQEFAHCLLDHPRLSTSILIAAKADMFAPKFVYEGRFHCPDGTQPQVRTIWEWRANDTHARLVTAYPSRPAIRPSRDPSA